VFVGVKVGVGDRLKVGVGVIKIDTISSHAAASIILTVKSPKA
jgi:hypothetical protein